MADLPYPEITLLRGKNAENGAGAQGGNNGSPAPGRGTRRVQQPKDQKPVKKQVNPDERLRHIISILLLLGAALLLLALVSYTPRDQANTDIGVHDISGLLTHNPDVAARADTTENWLGLFGAFIANLLINSTVGYATLVLPILIGLWGVTIFNGKNYQRIGRISIYTGIIITLLASVFGTMQIVSWMPHPSHEWSGVIGAFIASILSGLLGTAGSFLILFALLLITGIYGTNSDLHKALEVAKLYGGKALAAIMESKSIVGAKLGQHSADQSTGDITARYAEQSAPTDNEPAQMVRRMRVPLRDEEQETTISIPAPRPAERAEPKRQSAATQPAQPVPFPEPRVQRQTIPLPTNILPAEEIEQKPKPAIAKQKSPEQYPRETAPIIPVAKSPEEIDDDLMLVSGARLARELERTGLI
ncbi:MAG: DNA translocase FtsK 4TM domain-containing protein, partial [Candidatus Kapaibacterium sp.]